MSACAPGVARFGPRAAVTRTAPRMAWEGVVMAWFVLVVAGLLEAVWATALGRSDGLTRLVPSVVFGIAMLLSMGGLALALRDLPTGTAYAVWVGIGAAGTVVYAMLTGTESVSLIKVLLITGLVGCVVGLQLVSDGH